MHSCGVYGVHHRETRSPTGEALNHFHSLGPLSRDSHLKPYKAKAQRRQAGLQKAAWLGEDSLGVEWKPEQGSRACFFMYAALLELQSSRLGDVVTVNLM